MARIRWTLRAADEFEAAIAYVEKAAPVAARRLAQKIMRRIRSLRRFPGSGGLIPEETAIAYRQLIEGNYRIIYRQEADTVIVCSLYHAARLLNSDELP